MLIFNFRAAKSFADYSAVGNTMHSVIDPLVYTLCIAASLVCAAFLVNAGIHYITSSGDPNRLSRAKKIIRDALLGLVLILGAAVLTAILTKAYGSPAPNLAEHLPTLSAVKPSSTSLSLVDILIKAITGILQNVIESIGKPFMQALTYFTSGTPLMAANGSVFKIWLAVLAIADSLFVLLSCLLGFHVMSASTLGLEEIEFKHLLPQLALGFALMNGSIFLIDSVISVSNVMIAALRAGFGDISVWSTLSKIANQSGGMGLAALLIMIVFLALAFILLVYYVGRIVTLYLGAVLSPLVFLIWLLPSFQDFAASAIKTYLSTIFVLFIHVVILLLADSILTTLVATGPNGAPDPIMSLIVGISTLVALIKTQGVLSQLNYVSVGPRSLRKLSGQFMNSISHSRLGYKSN